MTAIGTSQEGADVQAIRQIVLMCKMAGADLHHIGDTDYLGLALPENIFAIMWLFRGKSTPLAALHLKPKQTIFSSSL